MTATLPNSFATVHGRVQQSHRCQASAGFYQLSFQAMNTHCRVNFLSNDSGLAESFQREVLHWVAWFEAQYSRFISDSLIGRINAAAGRDWVEVDPETDALFNL
ncbi:MAG TPA: FAD:protein FMN transferase, partial [Candidatus Acidoferrales bacterium]|nr:FAD:protein FMN transferase [Candidatus Acidoferrales bacterium]